jgi:AcrR family transcriptional regulator
MMSYEVEAPPGPDPGINAPALVDLSQFTLLPKGVGVSQEVSARSRRASHPKSAITRQRILDAAARAFSLKGYAATTVNDIALIAEMQGGSIYYYFESKDDILQEVLDVGITRVFSAVRLAIGSLAGTAAFSEKLEAAVTAHLTMLLQQGDYTSANIRVFEQAPDAVKRQNRKLRAAYGEYWGKLFSEGQRSGAIRKDVDLTILRLLLLGAMNWAVTWYRPDSLPVSNLAQKICDIVLNGSSLDSNHLLISPRGRRARS